MISVVKEELIGMNYSDEKVFESLWRRVEDDPKKKECIVLAFETKEDYIKYY